MFYGKNMKFKGLNGNALKIIAAITMFIDHVGMILFPQEKIFRMIGRIAFPIFAFFIAEGCRYTRNKKKYLGLILCLGSIFQAVFTLATKQTMLNIFLTFSLSIILVYFLQWFKKELQTEKLWGKAVSGSSFFIVLILVYLFTNKFTVDYGFFGVMIPVLVSVFDGLWGRKIAFAISIVLLAFSMHTPTQSFCLLAVPILFLYMGKKGTIKMKYFFYIFYPLHLCILFLLDMIL